MKDRKNELKKMENLETYIKIESSDDSVSLETL